MKLDGEKYDCYSKDEADAKVKSSGVRSSDTYMAADYSIIPLVQTEAGIKEDYTKCKSAANRFSKPNE